MREVVHIQSEVGQQYEAGSKLIRRGRMKALLKVYRSQPKCEDAKVWPPRLVHCRFRPRKYIWILDPFSRLKYVCFWFWTFRCMNFIHKVDQGEKRFYFQIKKMGGLKIYIWHVCKSKKTKNSKNPSFFKVFLYQPPIERERILILISAFANRATLASCF